MTARLVRHFQYCQHFTSCKHLFTPKVPKLYFLHMTYTIYYIQNINHNNGFGTILPVSLEYFAFISTNQTINTIVLIHRFIGRHVIYKRLDAFHIQVHFFCFIYNDILPLRNSNSDRYTLYIHASRYLGHNLSGL